MSPELAVGTSATTTYRRERERADRPTANDRAYYAAGTCAMAEWDWTYTPYGGRLHAVELLEDPERWDMWEPRGFGRTVCGLDTTLTCPGIFSRMGTPRCAHCCRLLGIPRGRGSPKNDDALRPWVEERLQAMIDAA